MPKISVVILIYNVEPYIEQCLESITTQTFKDIEILCIDDCGGDNSINIAKNYAAKDNRVKIIKLSKNNGLGAARNKCLSLQN
jgi:glycosyltransferase involved in cell wall biosynthesis